MGNNCTTEVEGQVDNGRKGNVEVEEEVVEEVEVEAELEVELRLELVVDGNLLVVGVSKVELGEGELLLGRASPDLLL